ncbi:hypothetical protein MMC14_010715 [Varicellaria rhodocarpa]|nr:hypothetical protein [Varicellaria rhodocarpa]
MAKLSWMAYQTPEKVNSMWGKEDEALENTNWSPLLATTESVEYASCASCDAQAYAVKLNRCPRAPLVLACRGTSSIADAMIDVSVQLVPFSFADGKPDTGVAVHRGFYEQFKGILPKVDDLYKGHLADGGTLICTGHSLGSAVAALAALYYGAQYPKQVAYIGFGTPRVGNGAFAKKFDSVVLDRTRVANGRDPVRKIPPPLGYTHVGSEEHVGRSDPYPSIPALTDLPDHDIDKGYIRNLAEPSQKTSAVPAQHASWLTEALSKFRL